MEREPDRTRWLSPAAVLGAAALAVLTFHTAHQWPFAGGLVVLYLACLYRLAWVPTTRWAFYLGLTIGFLVAAPQLRFLVGIFGPAAVGLWLALGLWHAFYLLIARSAVGRWPRCGHLWLPVLWLGLEYFRSELYHLRFSWLTPGFALTHPAWRPFASTGVYGFSFLAMLVFTALHLAARSGRTSPKSLAAPATLIAAGAALVTAAIATSPRRAAAQHQPFIVGIQLEGASDAQMLDAMESAIVRYPQLDLLVLPEYTFDGPVSEEARDWCRRHQRYLIAGGKQYVDSRRNDYENTAWVFGPDGTEIFRQVKSVPVQFMQDGRPARSQQVWSSPWGRIGIALCYDLSYTRVIDRLIQSGAQALVVPTMELTEWGELEHSLHARVAPVRAREYRVPILRVCSSGISQLVDRDGRVLQSAPFPGQGEMIAGTLPLGAPGRVPPDRYLALPAAIVVAALALFLTLRGRRPLGPLWSGGRRHAANI